MVFQIYLLLIHNFGISNIKHHCSTSKPSKITLACKPVDLATFNMLRAKLLTSEP